MSGPRPRRGAPSVVELLVLLVAVAALLLLTRGGWPW